MRCSTAGILTEVRGRFTFRSLVAGTGALELPFKIRDTVRRKTPKATMSKGSDAQLRYSANQVSAVEM
jgi:hypothetical protein